MLEGEGVKTFQTPFSKNINQAPLPPLKIWVTYMGWQCLEHSVLVVQYLVTSAVSSV